ncbi:MAG: NADH-quinone oxidoreductase subunit A [Sulfurimonas sp.]|uniref:NADH-quinone oxidoreductase subunit A n=1 Tax=Sulfurimonas sp. TaxID=2022749 RepID=UPI002631C2DA|nr:NADH-quinone oxidoreductase subunit A [Sulfurimonas sp.]MCW8895716.1 NADH-quinone oxidoreductase subunit A [Sulfurimonas sp.]MCW8953684.1 NADH-quinone oxidoreductase subunit A [Sulfurimonas sp.]MCW9068236.1 NADH-quinone oxidoreductase subunit A [Sulfurimonas sp.]
MNYNFYLPLTIILLLAVIIPFLFHLSRYIGEKTKHNTSINETYESGVKKTYKDSFERFNIKYYLVAIIFVLFDVEILFMFPWAVTLRETNLLGLFEMFTFMFFLLAGLIYIYKKGALKWD